MKKTWLALLLAIVLVIGMVNVGYAKDYTLSFGHGVMESHPTHFGALRVKELVEERSNGRLKIDIYPNRQLGEEREMVEGLQMGTVDITSVSTGPLGGFVPEIGVVDLPFLFKSSIHAYGVLDGPIGDELLSEFSDVGIHGVAFWENGWRHLTANKPIKQPEDLKGLKIRTMENKVHMDAFKEMGASPIPMVWGEVYTSLNQGVIDAQENPFTVIYTNNLWEVQDYTMETGHLYSPHVVLASQRTLDKLPKDLQKILVDTIKEVTVYQRGKSIELGTSQKELVKEEGMKVVEVDKTPFQKAVAPVYKKYSSKFGEELINRIVTAGGGEPINF